MRPLLLEVTIACAVTLVALAATYSQVHAQTAPGGTPLPPVAVDPVAKKKAEAKRTKAAASPAPSTSPPIVDQTEGTTRLPDGAVVSPGIAVEATTAGPVQGYRALSASSATKTDTAIERVPQSIQVIPKSLISDQYGLSVTEILRNVSNVQGAEPHSLANTSLQPLRIRGFGAEQWLDGLSVAYNAGDRDSFINVERIEVLKGPNAILYGGASGAPIGGAVNIVSKMPTDRASGEIGFKFGSFKHLHPYFDINQPLVSAGTVLFRITGEYASSESFIDVLETDRYSINPTVTLTNKSDTTLTIQARASKAQQQIYPGLPVVGTLVGSYRLDRDMFASTPDIPRGYSEVQSITVTLDHRFDSVWSGSIKTRFSQSDFEQNAQVLYEVPSFFITAPFYAASNAELHQEQKDLAFDVNVKAKFAFGPTTNTFLLGGDYSRVTDKGRFNQDTLGTPGFACFDVPVLNLTNPSYPKYTDPDPKNPCVLRFSDLDTTYQTSGVYTQLQSTVYDRFHLLAGARFANVKIDYESGRNALGFPETITSNTDETKVLPRIGAVIDLFQGISVYASYSEGMKGQPTTGYLVTPRIEESEQREAGFKFNFGGQFSGTLAAFEIDRSNVAVTNNSFLVDKFARQRARGYEADVLWQASENWQVLANYGFVDAVFADSLVVPAGNKFSGVPEHTGRVWLNYKFDPGWLAGWSVGAGVTMTSSQFVDSANRYQVDGFHTFDAKIAYDTKNFSAAVFVKNLTGEKYYLPYSSLWTAVAPGDDRAVYGVIAYKW